MPVLTAYTMIPVLTAFTMIPYTACTRMPVLKACTMIPVLTQRTRGCLYSQPILVIPVCNIISEALEFAVADPGVLVQLHRLNKKVDVRDFNVNMELLLEV